MNLLKISAKIFLAGWIFLIPSSLSYHLDKSAGLVNGVLVDYRIPAISASQLFLTAFLITLIFSLSTDHGGKHYEFIHSLGRLGTTVLIVSFIFQCALGVYQLRFQRSLTGYLPLGEVDYVQPQIAKGVFGGSIYKLPYGTTAHPNVLAGFLVISFLTLLLQPFVKIDKRYRLFLFMLTVLMCFLTQSLVAATALLIAGVFFQLVKIKARKLVRLFILLLPIFSFLFFIFPFAYSSPNPSVARRAQLQQIALRMVESRPLTGVGWNNFTLLEEQYGLIPGPIRFLQPVHNVFLLLIAELGILGLAGVLLLGRAIWKVNAFWLPLLGALVFIGSFDHYLLTLSSGRMLLLLFFSAIYLSRKHQQQIVII